MKGRQLTKEIQASLSQQGEDADDQVQIKIEEEKMKELTINMSENIGKLLKMIHDAPQVTVSVVEVAIQFPVIVAINVDVEDIEIGRLEPCPRMVPNKSDH